MAIRSPDDMWAGDASQWTQETKLRSLDIRFADKVRRVLVELRKRGFKPKIVYGWRSLVEQAELYKAGQSNFRFSFHNACAEDGSPAALAVDVIDERWGMEAGADGSGFWFALGRVAKQEGLVWGGDWKGFPHVAHIQAEPNTVLAEVQAQTEAALG